ncbi:hypothetical protein D3C87_1420900 [compost metagenome]
MFYRHHWHDDRFGTRQIPRDIPDFQHRLVFECVKRVSIQPLLERQTLLRGAVIGMQAHAPVRCGIGDGVVFGLGERVVGH